MKNDDDYDDRSEEEMYPPPRKKTRSSDQTRKPRTASYVWKYFIRDAEKDSKTATCNICQGEVKRNTSSTSMLIAHLHRAHNIEREFECKRERTGQKILKNYDMNIPSPPTPPEEEGAAIRSFDVGVRELMANPEKLKGSFISDYESDRSVVNNEIISDLARNEQFSATIIETSACPQRRFLNVSLCSARKSYFLGMIPVTELDGNQVARLVEKKLTEFGLDFWQDLIGITTHSSTMMSVDGDGPLHQLCLAHVIQLCVKDVLYVEHLEGKAESPAMMVEVVFDVDLDEEDEFDALKRKYWRLVSKVCRAVKLFENEHCHEYPRRWSNLLKIIKRFISYSKRHTFAADEDFTPEELASVHELCVALGPLQQLCGYLMKPKVDLVHADNLFGFTLALLDRQETPVSGLIRDRLQTRYLERRNCDVVHVMNFLKDPKYLEKGSDHFGVAIEKQTIVDSTALLIERLRVRGKTKQQLGNSVSKNVEMYCKKSSKRPKLLDNLHTSLLTIHPTSVESLNRSSMKWLGPPGARAAISDELLNVLMFMRRQCYLDSGN